MSVIWGLSIHPIYEFSRVFWHSKCNAVFTGARQSGSSLIAEEMKSRKDGNLEK